MIIVDNIHKHFGGFKAVDGTTLEIKKDEKVAVMGTSGSGKTSLIKLLLKLKMKKCANWETANKKKEL